VTRRRTHVDAIEHDLATGTLTEIKVPIAGRQPVERYELILVIECYLLGIKPVLNEADQETYGLIRDADLVVLQLPNARSGRIVKDRYAGPGHEEIDGRELAFLRRRGTVVAL
jgi:hypothetical protein